MASEFVCESAVVLHDWNKKLQLNRFSAFSRIPANVSLLPAALGSCSINSPILPFFIQSPSFPSSSSSSPSWSSSLQWNLKKAEKKDDFFFLSNKTCNSLPFLHHISFVHILSLLMPANSCHGDGEVLGGVWLQMLEEVNTHRLRQREAWEN